MHFVSHHSHFLHSELPFQLKAFGSDNEMLLSSARAAGLRGRWGGRRRDLATYAGASALLGQLDPGGPAPEGSVRADILTRIAGAVIAVAPEPPLLWQCNCAAQGLIKGGKSA